MIILDTNVVSEPMRRRGSPLVLDWLNRQPSDNLFLTATSLSELLLGIAILPDGRRQAELEIGLAGLLSRLFADRILPFDERAARVYARMSGHARAIGRPLSMADGQIAAVAAVNGFAVATRDRLPFDTAGILVIDPWQATDERL